jgi:orotate phosphoribosyltransferase
MARHVDGTRIAGMELGAVPIAAAVALQTDLPFCILRKKPREHGTGSQIEGEVMPGETVTVVEDVATTGGSIVQSVKLIRAAGGVVKRAIVVVDREEGAAEALRAENVELLALVKRSRLMQGK